MGTCPKGSIIGMSPPDNVRDRLLLQMHLKGIGSHAASQSVCLFSLFWPPWLGPFPTPSEAATKRRRSGRGGGFPGIPTDHAAPGEKAPAACGCRSPREHRGLCQCSPSLRLAALGGTVCRGRPFLDFRFGLDPLEPAHFRPDIGAHLFPSPITGKGLDRRTLRRYRRHFGVAVPPPCQHVHGGCLKRSVESPRKRHMTDQHWTSVVGSGE